MPKKANTTWDRLAQVYAASREVSADRLIEWPAQLRMCRDFAGKRVLDAGCGSGEKALYFAEHGAVDVLGVDPSQGFVESWKALPALPNVHFAQGSFESLLSIPEAASGCFDLIVSFQALMYAANLRETLADLASLLAPGGTLVFSVPHPFRFAILRNEIEGWGHGYAYQQTGTYRYPSPWKSDILLEHAMPRISDYMNAVIDAGLKIKAVDEPAVTEEFRALFPQKAAWMDRYVGILIVRAGKPSSSPIQESAPASV